MKIAVLILAILTAPCVAETAIAQIANEDISDIDRDAAVESLKHAEISTTAPPILRLLCDYASPEEPGIGEKPWMSPYHSHRAKVWYAAGAVWKALFTGKNDPAKAAILLQLLHDYKDTCSRHRVLQELRFHWNAEAEKQVADLVQRRENPDDIKLDALCVLLVRAGEPYVPHAVDFVQSAPENNKSLRFQRLFNVGERFFKYSRKNRAEIFTLGFTILETEARPGTSVGYFLARQLGYFVKVPGEFAPDPHAAQYQGKSGLNEQFFVDTVQNALEWRRKNPARVATTP